MQKSDLPQPLQTLLDISKVKRVNIDLTKKSNTYTPDKISKVGGMGYLPMGENYPTKKDGTPLVMLAQVNFDELSKAVDTSQLPHPLPNKGILQIYIDGKDDNFLFGADLDNYLPYEKYQVRFWQDDTLAINDDELKNITEKLKSLDIEDFPFDVNNEYKMTFTLSEQSCHTDCFEYYTISENIAELDGTDVWCYLEEDLGIEDPDEFLQIYDNFANSNQHQIFGYPHFTQTDPREFNEHLQEHILLLQIETDDVENDIMWGDSGVANFFIHPKDLAKQDFSKVLFNWDCC